MIPAASIFIWDQRINNRPEPFAPGRALDVRTRTRALEDAALIGHASMTVLGLGAPERWAGASVSPSFFDVLGAPPDARPDVPSRRSRPRLRRAQPPAVGDALRERPGPRRPIAHDERPAAPRCRRDAGGFLLAVDHRDSRRHSTARISGRRAPANDVPEGPVPTGRGFRDEPDHGIPAAGGASHAGRHARERAGGAQRRSPRDLAREYPATDERPRPHDGEHRRAVLRRRARRRCSFSPGRAPSSCCSRA